MRFKTDDDRHRGVPAGRIRAEVAEVEGKDIPTVTLQMLTYFDVDSYGSLWTPGVLTAGIRKRLPQLAWSHSWSEIIGRALPDTYVDNEIGPQLTFYFNNFDDVPTARRIYSQIKDGTLDECSIGFGWDYIARDPTEDEREQYPGVREVMIEAALDEVSIVLRGAVPNAKVIGVRSREGNRFLGQRQPMMIDAEEASRIITEVKGGHMDLLTALQQVSEASVASDEQPVSPTVEPEKTESSEEEKKDDTETQTEPEVTPVVEPETEETPAEDDKPEPEVPAEVVASAETQEPSAEDEPKADETKPTEEEPKIEPGIEPQAEPEAPVAEPEVTPTSETSEPAVEPTPETPIESATHEPVFTEADLAMLADVDSVLAEREAI